MQRSLDPGDYSIGFAGDHEGGVVHLRSKDGRKSRMLVAKIDGDWVINER